MVCSVCKERIPDDAVFCPECGAPVSSGSVNRSGIKYCPECGTEVGADDVFCPECGAELIRAEDEKMSGGGPKDNTWDTAGANTWNTTGDGLGANTWDAAGGSQTKDNKNRLYLIISIAAVVIIGVLIVGITFFRKGGGDQDAEKNPMQLSEEDVDGEEEDETKNVTSDEPEYKDEAEADLDCINFLDCEMSGTMMGEVLSLEEKASVYAYDQDGNKKLLNDVKYIYIDKTPADIDLTDYEAREVIMTAGLTVKGEKVLADVKTIETTDGPLYDSTEGGIHKYEIVIKDCGWKQAFNDSRSKGGYLVRINSYEEYQYLLKLISTYGCNSIHFYIGGCKEPDGKGYYWVDENGDTFGERLNGNPDVWCKGEWMAGEPSYEDPNLKIEEPYMNIFYYSGEGRWVWNDGPENIPAAVSAFSGKVGYIIEYED